MKNKIVKLIGSRTGFLFFVLLVEMVIFSFSSDYFFTVRNILGSTQFGAVLAIAAIGQSLIWLGGGDGIDLSVGSIISLSGVIFGLSYNAGAGLFPSIAIAIISGALFGMINGALVAYIGIPALIATLGTQFIYGSIALFLTKGTPISGFPEDFGWLSLERTFGLPNQVLFLVIPIFIIFYIAVYKTTLGRKIYLVGTNAVSARFTSISKEKTRFWLYTVSGVLAGVSSIIMCSWLMTSRANAGEGMEIQIITVTALGGIGVSGGSGSLSGVMIAILIVTFLNSGLDLSGINTIWQLGILGVMLIGAVSLNQYVTKTLQKI